MGNNAARLQKLSDIVPLDVPLSIAISPNNMCNIKCNYCYHGSEKKKTEVTNGNYKPYCMDEAAFEKIVHQIAEFGKPIKQITLIGLGEPLINKNLPNMIRALKSNGISEKVKISSNALLLNHELSNELISSGLDVLKVSLQGLTSEKYEKICGIKMDFDRFVDELRYFSKIKGKCFLHIKIPDIALDFEKGEDRIFQDIFAEFADFIDVENINEVDDKGDIIDIRNRWDNFIDAENAKVCYFPFYYLDIKENGDVMPCCNGELVLGNIYKTRLKEIWDLKANGLCIDLLKGNINSLQHCRDCKIWKVLMREENYLDDAKDTILKRSIEFNEGRK